MTEAPRSTAPVGRLAPSPTGLLHLGHARSFLLAWWSVRSRSGRLVLRLEDLDGARSRPELSDAALRDLAWLGLDWDGPARIQSEDAERLLGAVEELLERGLAYACVCTRGDVKAAASAPQQGDTELRYPGTCRGRFGSWAEAERTGSATGVRFRVPDGAIVIRDAFCPPLECDVQSTVGDFPIARRDRSPAYQLAVVVDDAHQGVTEVLRGDDLLPSTARQWHLQRALGLPHPEWVHVPLVVDEQGRRFAKRADDLSLGELRARGVDPRAVVAWAARSAGMDVPERVTAREVTSSFALSRLPREPVRFGAAELARLREAR